MDQYRFDRDPAPKGRRTGAAADFSRRGAGPLRRQQHRSHDDDEAGGARTRASCPSTRATTAAPAIRRTPTATPRPTSGRRSGSATAGWRSSAATSSPSADRRRRSRASSSRASTSSTPPASSARRCSQEGAGSKYLIQHSAGSGKTNSIAWSAHFLADLHDDQDRKVFDTVVVVSDRNVIDTQLQEAIFELRADHGRGRDDHQRCRRQERAARRGAGRRQEDRRLHDPDLPLRAGGRAGAGGDAGQAVLR